MPSFVYVFFFHYFMREASSAYAMLNIIKNNECENSVVQCTHTLPYLAQIKINSDLQLQASPTYVAIYSALF